MASEKESTAASSSMGEGTGGSQQAAEGVTAAVAPPPSSPLPVPQPEPFPDDEMVVPEDKDSPPPPENVPDAMEGVEGDAPPPPPPLEAAPVQEIAPPAEGQAAGDFTCEICGARYPTEKAMFGHLRSHRDRGWRGAFSPPTFSMDEFAEYRDLLVKPEEEQLREIEEEERAAAGERVVLDVDLNEEAAEVEAFILPDLNLPPPDAE